ncbi:MAG: pyrroloquinoline quinone precursor peptide PqqA [Pseudolabrys sp.]
MTGCRMGYCDTAARTSLCVDNSDGLSTDFRRCTQAAPDLSCGYRSNEGRPGMTWTAPTLVEICIGLEINGYLPAEF